MTRLSEDHKEIQSGKKLDNEGYGAKVEMDKIIQSVNKLKKVIKTSDQQIPYWVQSKIIKASDYLDISADYLASDVEMEENVSFTIDPKSHTRAQKRGPQLPEETSLVDKILSEIEEEKKYMTKEEDPCWKGYRMIGKKKKNGKEVPNCVPVSEATTRLPMQTGQILRVLINWRGKHLSVQMFFPQLGTPRRDEITYAVNKVYPEARVISYVPSELDSSTPIVQVREESELLEFQKSNLKCNDPKSDPVGDSQTGKSHVVKACEKGKEKLIRFGQRGVKGSPKKKGESRAHKSRRLRFRARHRKNIKKGKMSAAYWSSVVKW
jgi:hypothetical protein